MYGDTNLQSCSDSELAELENAALDYACASERKPYPMGDDPVSLWAKARVAWLLSRD